MSKLCRTLAGGTMALAFMALPSGAHAQEVPAVPPEAAVVEPQPVVVTLAPVSGAEGSGEANSTRPAVSSA